MALNKNDLLSLIANDLPDNSDGLITPAALRTALSQMVGSDLNLIEQSQQTVTGATDFTGGITKNGQEIEAGLREVELLRAYSLAASQEPSATDTPLALEFGPAQGTVNDKVMISATGVVTFNEAGVYPVRIKLQKGRVGASGVSVVFSRILINGAQFGVSAAAKITSADFVTPTESRVLIPANAGDTFTVEIIRDSSGANSGGVFSKTSSVGWNISPSALLVVSNYEGV